MEIIASLFILLSSLLFIFVIVVNVFKKPKESKLPPGPWKLPIIGNLHQLIGPLPHRTLLNLALKHGPLMHIKLGEVSTIIISSPDTAKQALRDHDIIFAQRPDLLVGKIISYNSTGLTLARYGEYWREMRKFCAMELLSSRRVHSFRAIREEEVSNLLKSISRSEGSPVNLSNKIFSLSYGTLARVTFGGKSKDQDEFVAVVRAALALGSTFAVADMYPSVKLIQTISGMRRNLEKFHKKIDILLENILNEHRARQREFHKGDLVDALLRIQRESNLEFPVSNNNIKAIILDMFAAGSDTSSTVLEWALSEMLKNPSIMQKAKAEVIQANKEKGNIDESDIDEFKYLNAIIKETLRLHPSGPLLLPKETTKECKINGFSIPANSRVIVNAWAIGRDPTYWVEAEKFNPERFLDSDIDFRGNDFEYIPFGAGRRMCPGITYSLLSIKLQLAQLIFHFDWRVGSGIKLEDLDMEEAFGVTVRRRNDLILIPIIHDHSNLK